jgi:zinc-RING finger domain
MECPVCYSEFDLDTHRPKITQCGHSICEDCIKHMSKCCICKQEFQQTRDTFSAFYGGNRIGYFDDSLDRYMQINSLRGREFGWNRPTVTLPPVVQPGYSTNYALLELIQKKQPKQFTTCSKSKEYEDFYCLECEKFTCNSCIDEDHVNHGLKKVTHDVVTTFHSLNSVAGVIDKEIIDAVMMDDSLSTLKQKNAEVAVALPEKINSFFDELIQEIQETRKKVLDSVAKSSSEKETRVDNLITQNEALKSKFSDVSGGVHGLIQKIRESKYMFDQELKPKSEQLTELHKQAQSSLTYLKAQSETDDLKVADFSHAKNNCLLKFRDALESTLRLSTVIEPSLQVSRAGPSEPSQHGGHEQIPLDDLNDGSDPDNRNSLTRSRSTGSRFARALSGLDIGIANDRGGNSRRSESGSASAHSRRLEISASDQSRLSNISRERQQNQARMYPWNLDARNELLEDNRNQRGYFSMHNEYPHRNNFFGRSNNFSALEVIERITQANRAPPTQTTGNSSVASHRNLSRTRSHHNHSDGVENNSGMDIPLSHETRSQRTRSRRSSHNSALNREVLHRAISNLNRMEREQRRRSVHSDNSSITSSLRSNRATETQQNQAPLPAASTPSSAPYYFFSNPSRQPSLPTETLAASTTPALGYFFRPQQQAQQGPSTLNLN